MSQLNQIRLAFDAFPIATDPEFKNSLADGRLQYAAEEGKADIVDELGARLICSALTKRHTTPILLMLPDRSDRRCPLLFSVAIVMDAVHSPTSTKPVLYIGNHIGIRKQLSQVRIGSLNLSAVFKQTFTRGDLSTPPASATSERPQTLVVPQWAARLWTEPGKLPNVLCVYSPSDPEQLIEESAPRWIAVDLNDPHRTLWLPHLLKAAARRSIPVIGWTSRAFVPIGSTWLDNGGGVFRWPRRVPPTQTRISVLSQLFEETHEIEITPHIISSKSALKVSNEFTKAAEILAQLRRGTSNRLLGDTIFLGSKYLWDLESSHIPIDAYDRETEYIRGAKSLDASRDDFSRFVEACRPSFPKEHGRLQAVLEALVTVHEEFLESGPCLWHALTGLCLDSTVPRRIVFPSKWRCESFCSYLLAKFNIGRDDLKGVNVWIGYLKEVVEDEAISQAVPLIVGLSSPQQDTYLEDLFHSKKIDVLIWPHQEGFLSKKIRYLASELNLASIKMGSLMPPVRGGEVNLKLTEPKEVNSEGIHEDPESKSLISKMWKRLDAADVFKTLFDGIHSEDAEESPLFSHEDAADSGREGSKEDDSTWVQEALSVRFADGHVILFPLDETVNVVANDRHGSKIEERYVRSLRQGDEILFIQGQRRQSLYELLVSRVHRDPAISQYLSLVRRWQSDFSKSFKAKENSGQLSAESLLRNLQSKGSAVTSPMTVRLWLRGMVLAPHDVNDLLRLSEILSIPFIKEFYVQIHRAGRRLKGLHISLSARLNQWLSSPNSEIMREESGIIDASLGISVEDFKHSFIRLRVIESSRVTGPFCRENLGTLEKEI